MSNEGETSSNEPTFSIQPHPGPDPADPPPKEGPGLASSKGVFSAFEASSPHIVSAEIASQLPPPKSREELKARQEELNKKPTES